MRIKTVLVILLASSLITGAAAVSFSEGHIFHIEDRSSTVKLGSSYDFSSASLYGVAAEFNSTNLTVRAYNNTSLNSTLNTFNTDFQDGDTVINLSVKYNGSESEKATVKLENLPDKSGSFSISYAGSSETLSASTNVARNISSSDFTFKISYSDSSDEFDGSEESSGDDDSGDGESSGGGFFAVPESSSTEPENCLEFRNDRLNLSGHEVQESRVNVSNVCNSSIPVSLEGPENIFENASFDLAANSDASRIVKFNLSVLDEGQEERYSFAAKSGNQSVSIPLRLRRKKEENEVNLSLNESPEPGEEVGLEGDVEELGRVEFNLKNDSGEIIEKGNGTRFEIPEKLQTGNYTLEVSGTVSNGSKISEKFGFRTENQGREEESINLVYLFPVSLAIIVSIFVLLRTREKWPEGIEEIKKDLEERRS